MVKTIFSVFIFLIISCWSVPTVLSQETVTSTTCNESLAKPIQKEALGLMTSKKYNEAAFLYKKITVMCPKRAEAFMNYGSALFASASKYFDRNKETFTKDAIPILQEAAVNLKKAITLFGNNKESNSWKAHAHYLLGDIYQYGLLDFGEAEKMYRESLSLNYFDYATVQKELENIQNKKIKNR